MTNGDVGTEPDRRAGWDFFVSYTKDDRAWAEWIAWQLEEVGGFRVLVQAWDMVPGTRFVVGMQNGVTRAQRTIAVLSEAYTYSQFGAAEWQAAWSADPAGFERKLLVVRVEECSRPGLLDQVVSFDLFEQPEDMARDELVRWATFAVSGGRAKPTTAPPFPGSSPGTARPAPKFPRAAGTTAVPRADPINDEGRFFGPYQKALDHLDSTRAHTRMGGLRTLSALGQEYVTRRQAVVDAICGYLRTPWDSDDLAEAEVRRSALAILAGHLRPSRGEDSLPQSASFWEGISVDLVGAVLHEARFDGCEFAAADFERATFIGSTGFCGAHFLGTARFLHATFEGWWADFRKTTFSGVTWFRWVNFTVNAMFGLANFRLNAEFSRAQFSADADFTGIKVGKVGWFTHNIFHGSALFQGARFNVAIFEHVEFGGHVNFTGARFAGGSPKCVDVRYYDPTMSGFLRYWPEGWTDKLRSVAPPEDGTLPSWW